tara:strand:- start:1026 stop:1190 length:165 start_codon:yes stop_codon:yes gene_type:complete
VTKSLDFEKLLAALEADPAANKRMIEDNKDKIEENTRKVDEMTKAFKAKMGSNI